MDTKFLDQDSGLSDNVFGLNYEEKRIRKVQRFNLISEMKDRGSGNKECCYKLMRISINIVFSARIERILMINILKELKEFFKGSIKTYDEWKNIPIEKVIALECPGMNRLEKVPDKKVNTSCFFFKT